LRSAVRHSSYAGADSGPRTRQALKSRQ